MADGEDYSVPFAHCRDYSKDPENFTEVHVDIPGLKKKMMSNDPANAEIDLKVKDRTMCLNVRLASGKLYRYEIKQLPDSIKDVSSGKDGTYYKVNGKSQVVLYLHKQVPRKWEIQLADIGLETEGFN